MSERPITTELRATAKSESKFYIDPDLKVIVVFSLIGILIALNLIFRFPGLGTVIAESNLF
jgi:hypothetical protein